ncbi:TetR/AcrR family transcriptional regulator [Rhizobium sp.]|jgi:AcrR family transcriptional regulator|uniref:TetR/AcrR family transcriptional regulator n=1 Tax=Rhizobium sp. TaxID=391 RepID=UPI000647361C
MTSTLTSERRTSIGAQRNPASQEAILKAAADILRETGLSGFSIEAVARRAHAGKPTIYRWWSSRAALLLDVYHDQKHVEPVPDTGSIESDLFAFVTALFDYWRDSEAGSIFRFVIAEAQSDATTSAALRTYMAERIDQTAELVRRAKRRGEINADVDPELTIELLAGFAWSRLLTRRLNVDPQQLHNIIGQMIRGLGSGGDRGGKR